MHLIEDPQLAEALARFENAVPGGITLNDIPATRQLVDSLVAATARRAPTIEGVLSSDHYVPGPESAPKVKVRIYQPETRPGSLPALLWIHGGGFVLGNIEKDDLLAKRMSLAMNCVIASVEYRLAPEHPFPAPLDDCYSALEWLVGQAEQLGVNTNRIAIGGASAGGCLAAGVSLMARDKAEIDICYQLLIYPVLDDTNVEQTGPGLPDTLFWTRANNLKAWRAYLGQEPGGENISPYAAPIRAKDLSGLPPTFIGVGTPDLFLNENIAYAQRLMKAGVSTDLHVYADGFHSFDELALESDVSKRFIADYSQLLIRALHG